MNPLDIGEDLIDREKSSLMFYYLVQAAERVQRREESKKKLAVSLKQLKKLDTDKITSHLDVLQENLKDVIGKEEDILATQSEEDVVHKTIKDKIKVLEKKLGKFLQTQEKRKDRFAELEQKVKERFLTKKDRVRQLKEDMKRLSRFYHVVKKSKKHNKKDLARVEKQLKQLKEKVKELG